MDFADIAIAHRNGETAARLVEILTGAGYSVAPPVRDLEALAGTLAAVAIVDLSLVQDGHIDLPTVIVASEGHRIVSGGGQCIEAVVYEPFRQKELETTLSLVLQRLGSNHDQALIQSVRHYALFMLDADGIVTSWNPGSVVVYGYEASEIIGKHYSVFYTEEDRAQKVPEAELRTATDEGHADDTRWLVHKNGERFWAEGVTTAVRNHRGNVVGFAKVTRDATERRNLEQQLERSNDELQRFAYTVSHDLQEPLRTIRSYAELLSRRYGDKLDQDAGEFITFMMDAAGRMTQLLKDLLTYSQAGRPDRTLPEPAASANILQWAIMNVDRLAKETGATITYDPLPMVEADQTQLSQVFQNLLGNAIKYRSSDPPAIHISATRVDDLYEFAVRDNGIGVDPEHHDRIFGVFKRLHGKEVPGTGIGLAICRKIIESHGGRIWIESDVGKGSTVKFTLRAHD
jgi:PAS domain S-box-containing protein